MKAVVQRVCNASLSVDGQLISNIERGLVIYFGVGVGDTVNKAEYLAKKISQLRIFQDSEGKMNLSVKDISGEILSVSQFTLYADVSHGNRPGFTLAEKPELASKMYDKFCEYLEQSTVPVKRGIFGADMQIIQHNDGPITIIYEI